MNKRALYNKIMSNVAVLVKKALNEEYTGNDLKDDHNAVIKTIIRICNEYDIDSILIDDTYHTYYNGAMLDDLDKELAYIAIFDDHIYVRCIDREEIDVNTLSAKDLDTFYYIIRNIVADTADFVSDPYDIYTEMDDIYDSIISGDIELVITDKDKEDLYEAFETCGYEECDFVKTFGEPLMLNSIYNNEPVSIDIISCNLVCQLSGGETVRLEDIISDRDDIDTLINNISDYSE